MKRSVSTKYVPFAKSFRIDGHSQASNIRFSAGTWSHSDILFIKAGEYNKMVKMLT
jgi:hypothetical protein